MHITRIVILLIFILTITGCSGIEDSPMVENTPHIDTGYQKITPEQAKDILEINPDIILLDVRTEEEFREIRIPGAILLPDTMITEHASEKLPDKNAVILVYCRAGRRSENASRELISMGYTNVYDIGGIIDWTFETESD